MPALRLMLVRATCAGTGENMDWFVLADTPEFAVEKYLEYQSVTNERERLDFEDTFIVHNVTGMMTEPRTGDVIEWDEKYRTEIK